MQSAITVSDRTIQTPAPTWLTGVPQALVGVAIFSLTAPTMRMALRDFDPMVVGIGRMVVAAVPAAIVLLVIGSPRLTIRQIKSLVITVACLGFGFSGLIAAALRYVPSYHAGIVIGGIPLATSLFATLRTRKPQPLLFWVAALGGSLLVMLYGFVNAGFQFKSADLFLLLAAAICGLGYSEGSRLSEEIGTTVLTCWVPIVATPLALILCLDRLPSHWEAVHLSSWLALLYNGLFSAFIGFFFWYRGLALGGAARIGQIQLAQPFFTLAASAILLHETLSIFDWLTAGAVVGCIAMTQIASRWRRTAAR
jgi:drug/metabolite transporter (DMT)-like permease